MSRHARIEEISDSDSDPPDMDPNDFSPADILKPASSSRPSQPRAAPPTGTSPFGPQSAVPPPSAAQPNYERFKPWTSLYPVYFDASRTRAQGRRVGKELAVRDPLASEIAEAVRRLGLQAFYEVEKCHPKDWANVGRVKVLLKGRPKGGVDVKNKHHLYILVAEYLRAHPTTQEMQLKVRINGLPHKVAPPPAVPRGWKLGTVLPLLSPAVTGGGVSENMFKDAMAQMQGMEGGGAGPLMDAGKPTEGGDGGKKKDKSKKKNRG